MNYRRRQDCTSQALNTSLVVKAYKVMGIDLDPQGNFSIACGSVNYNVSTVYELMKREVTAEGAIQHMNGENNILPLNIIKEKKMKKSNVFVLIGCILLVIAIIFITFALNHPEMAFPWENSVTYIIYIVYIIATIAMFAFGIKTRKK